MNKTIIGGAAACGAALVCGHHVYTHSPSFLYYRLAPSIVSVESVGSKRNPYDIHGERMGIVRGTGTGFVVARSPLIEPAKPVEILTNFHVVEDSEQIMIRFAEEAPPLNAIITKVDPMNDTAVLEVVFEDLDTTALHLCKRDPEIGEDVLAIGNPFGLDKSLSVGVVSGLGRSVGGVLPDNMIQTDAVINPGNSGGPLISRRDGCVLGMNTATINQSSGIGFAVPSSVLSKVLKHN